MSQWAIELENVSCRFPLVRFRPRGVKEAFLSRFQPHRRPQERFFWALKGLSLQVAKGEVLGLIGHNGSGKSTLLKIVSGIYEPDGGQVRSYGRISSLIELGAGFQEELTGYENIFLNGSILGFSQAAMGRLADQIIEFSGLEEFIHQPLRTYSSGMKVRLGFAVASAIEPEILLVDEVLSVGDEQFRQKSMARIEEMARGETTILVVSHNLSLLQRLCHRLALLHKGELVTVGSPDEVIHEYHHLLGKSGPPCTGAVRIGAACLRDEVGRVVEEIRPGQETALELSVETRHSLAEPVTVGFSLYLNNLLVTEQRSPGLSPPPVGHALRVRCGLGTTPLAPGRYRLNLFAASGDQYHDHQESHLTFSVVDPAAAPQKGFWAPRAQWQAEGHEETLTVAEKQ